MHTNIEDNKDSFDQILGKKLLSYEEAPPEMAWNNIQKSIASNPTQAARYSSWKNIFFLTATVVVLTAVAIFIFNKQKIGKPETNAIPLQIKNNETNNTSIQVVESPDITNEVQKQTLNIAEEKNNNNLEQKKFSENPSVHNNTTIKLIASNKNVVVEDHDIENNSTINHSSIKASEHIKGVSNPDSVLQLKPDSVINISKPKSFFEKQRGDTTLKYRELFKKAKIKN